MRKLLARQRQFLVYLVGGCLCALIDIGIMQLLIAGGVNFLVATTVGFAGGLLVNFSFHSHLTFQSSPSAFSFARYLCVVALNYLITVAVVGWSVWLVGQPLVGKLISLPIVAINGYWLGKHWIFK
ncbi:MAG: GtrA family protein [Burkholderiaceae bacterium]|nr:GtrA family protein [Burkholderiaceae bacterium]